MLTQVYSREELKQQFGEDKTFSQVLTHLESEFWKKGQVICEIHIDGEFVDENKEKLLAHTNISDISSLELGTRYQEELICTTLRTILDWLPKLSAQAKALGSEMKLGSAADSKKRFVELIDGCKWLADSLFLLKPIVLEKINDPQVAHAWRNAEVMYTGVASEVLKAYSNSDFVTVADALEFDLTSSLDHWHELLKAQSYITTISGL